MESDQTLFTYTVCVRGSAGILKNITSESSFRLRDVMNESRVCPAESGDDPEINTETRE